VITLANSDPIEELAALAARTKSFAIKNGARWVESELYEYGADTVQCRVRLMNGRGPVPTLVATFYANGYRRGIREIAGFIEGRWKWPNPPKRALA